LTDNLSRRLGTDRRLGIGLVVLAVVGAVAVGLAWFTLRPTSIPHTGVNPYGANFFLDREVELWKQEKTLEMARAAGIVWIKQQFSWEEIEPLRKGEFEWHKYDRIVDLAERYGMQIIARLDRPPAWARLANPMPASPPDDPADYGDFVYEFVRRYEGRVRYVQIWNEPNLSAEWGFQRVDAVAYTRLLEVAYRRAKAADPEVVVLSAPLAITLEDASMRGNHNDLVFLEEMYQAGAGDFFDILSANAFGLDRPPEDPPAPDVLNFRRVELQRQIMERYGDEDKPVWINEYGWNAAPASFPDELLTWERVTEQEQAEYTVRGIAWAREHWPWLGVVNIWYFRQVGDVPPDRAAYYFALVDPEFNLRPVYEAVQQAARGMGTGAISPDSAGNATALRVGKAES
jgi:polysaccharide biosynthesis protein PslG